MEIWECVRIVLYSSPFPTRTPASRFLPTGWSLLNSGAPAPATACWRTWRRKMGRPLPLRRSRVPPRCPRGPCPTARRNETRRRTRWALCPGPERWGGSRIPHRRGSGCGRSGERRRGWKEVVECEMILKKKKRRKKSRKTRAGNDEETSEWKTNVKKWWKQNEKEMKRRENVITDSLRQRQNMKTFRIKAH